MLTIIETSRLTLKPFLENDAALAFGWFGDPVVMKYVPGGPDSSLRDTERRLATYREHQTTHGFSKWVVIERQSGEPIGDAGLMVLQDEGWIDLGFRLAAARWGQGLATEAASGWVLAAFRDLAIRGLGAFTHPDNRGSIRVLEKLGFELLRRDTVMGMNAMVFGLRATEGPANPALHPSAADAVGTRPRVSAGRSADEEGKNEHGRRVYNR